VGAAGRQWVPNMWAGRILTIRPRQAGMEESQIITSNTADTLTVGAAWTNNPAPGDAYAIRSGTIQVGGAVVPGNAAVALLSTDGGQSFTFLKFLDAGPQNAPIDYPAVATGPGRNANEKSVWFAWRSNNNKILADGAPVTAKGTVGAF